MKFAFWNLGNQSDPTPLKRLVADHNPDILALCEVDKLDPSLLEEISSMTLIPSIITVSKPKVRVLSRPNHIEVTPIQEHKTRLYLYRLFMGGVTFILACVHFPSKRYHSPESQLCEAIDYMEQINKAEADFHTRRTIVIGDFNMNPFDPGMIAGNAFNAVCSREIATKGQRQVQRASYDYFYNPCWRLFGNDTSGMYGTYFYNSPGHDGFHWNVFDQVLIRPQIMQTFNPIFEAVEDDFYFNHRSRAHSDHAPIKLSLERI